MVDTDRTVHARSANGLIEIVRYDRAGRWWMEHKSRPSAKSRLATVAIAVQRALDLERDGGTILLRQPGGQQFDTKVAGAKQKESRHR